MNWWRRFRSLARAKRPFRLTRGGWVFILYTVGVGAGAINTGNNLLYLIFGIFLGLIMASGALSDASLWALSVDWTFPESAEAGKPCFIPIRITNHKRWLPSLAVVVEMEGRLAGEIVRLRLFVPFISADQKISRQFLLQPARRGKFSLTSIKLYTRYPFGLLRKMWTLVDSETPGREPTPGEGIFVYPELLPLDWQDLKNRHAGPEPLQTVPEKGEGASIYSLRDYLPSDNPRRIHWKATAKRGFVQVGRVSSWLVREMEKDKSEAAVFRWPALEDFSRLDAARAEGFIRYTASVLWITHEHGQEAVLAAGEKDLLTFRAVPNRPPLRVVLEFLAIFDPSRPASPEARAYLEAAPQEFRERWSSGMVDLFASFESWSAEDSDGK